MPPEVSTLVMVGVGVLIGILVVSNWNLRAEVHSLRQQVTALTTLIGQLRGDVRNA